MIIKDMMRGFELYQPTTVPDALALLERHGAAAWALAGGNDSLVWFKERIKEPKVVVDLTGIPGLAGIRETDDGVEIGALTTLTQIERSPLLRSRYRVLADAARAVASPQIRNTGTIGGNVAQDARCPYYRYGAPCYRAGGDLCFADTPDGVNRDHALFDTERCIAVSPSDTAPALVAIDAQFVLQHAGGQRVLGADQFFIGPQYDITRMTALAPNELLTAIRLPRRWAGARFAFEKIADRKSWDFPLINIAAAFLMRAGTIAEARLVCGGVSAAPRRLREAESLISGGVPTEELGRRAGQVAIHGARPLQYNGFKVPLMANIVMRAIRDASA
jgi:xanthine dehydrogenase YagS FAD-binding subunit